MDTIWSIIQPYLSQRATLGIYYFETINISIPVGAEDSREFTLDFVHCH
jgi:hypothetical protein